MNYGLFIAIVLFFALYLLINIYIGKNLKNYLRIMGVKIKNDKIYWAAFMAVAFSYILARALNPFMPEGVDVLLTNTGAYYLAVMAYALIVISALKMLYILFKRRISSCRARIKAAKVFGTIGIVVVFASVVYGSVNARRVETTEYSLKMDKPGPKGGLKVVFASDIHLGNIVGNSRLEELIQVINKEKPDIVLLGGDIVDEDVEYFIDEKMADRLEKIDSKYGVYGVLGNHEYIGGSEEEFEAILSKSQVKILKDEHEEAGGVVLVGRDDLSGERFSGVPRAELEELLRDVDTEKPVIMMDHQPMKSGEAKNLGVDLLLSGHTHRGQLFPGSIITSAIYDIDWGIKSYGDMEAIVSSGYGTWGPPIKIGSNSEVVVINVEFKEEIE
ncbi:putative metallophosphoesterase [Andreesenia angusta]|uniref:Putative metallophosphoesterase n=1 Tax=Andreesenia angusta TaxID=39480 RepID=A0A1S1V9G7_9FIRM|nr:metallophosphoesterase [Andreesenia angusta]OHW63232.1 putative metallophosphoesterase [Andreesenia angusta]